MTEDKNLCELIGTVKDPIHRELAGGKSVTNLTIHTVIGKARGWHKCVVWDHPEVISEGMRVRLAGYIKDSSWIGKNGEKRYKTEIISQSFGVIDEPVQDSPVRELVQEVMSEPEEFDVPF